MIRFNVLLFLFFSFITYAENVPLMQQLATQLQTNVTQLAIKPIGIFNLVTVTFPADGQHQYYIMTPNKKLINTNVDPRDLSPALKKKYSKTSFMIINWGEPVYQSNSFVATLKITDTCVACKLIGNAKVKFDFSKEGKLIRTSLESFDKNKT